MDYSIFSYIQRLELMALFSGYPLLYALIHSVAGNRPSKKNRRAEWLIPLLPISYALLGTFYLWLQLRNFYPDYSFEKINRVTHQPYLQIWGLLSVAWWIPALRRRPSLSLLHSLVFFFLLIRDFFLQLSGVSADNNMVGNDMKIYTDSLIVNVCAFGLVVLTSLVFRRRNPVR